MGLQILSPYLKGTDYSFAKTIGGKKEEHQYIKCSQRQDKNENDL
jgi:hypothetical protein